MWVEGLDAGNWVSDPNYKLMPHVPPQFLFPVSYFYLIYQYNKIK